jgi:hypothetical protein
MKKTSAKSFIGVTKHRQFGMNGDLIDMQDSLY